MKKFVASTLVVLLLAQSLTPATYASISTDPAAINKLSTGKRVNAADDAANLNAATNATSRADYGYGTATENAGTRVQTLKPSIKATNLVDKYKNTDLGSLTTFGVIQAAIVGYASQIGGVDIFNDKETYFKLVDEFLNKYAPNFGFRMGDTVPAAYTDDPNTYYQSLTDTWSKNFPKEYDAVYLYAKTRQSSVTDKAAPTTDPVARPSTPTATAATACILSKEDESEIFQNKIAYEKLIKEGKLTEASEVFKKIESLASKCSGGTSSSVVQFTQDCSIAYSRFVAELNNLIAKNASMAEITKIKSLISATEKGENCTVETTVEQTAEIHKSLVAEVKKALNFGKNKESVIPENVVPNYCTSRNLVDGLKLQLAANDSEKLNEIKENIQTILEDVRDSDTKKPVLRYALGLTAEIQTEQNIKQNIVGKEMSAMDNFMRSLAVMLDALGTGRGVRTILGFVDGNIDNIKTMLEALDNISGFDSFEYVVQNGGSAYERNGTNFVQTKDARAQDDITFALPYSKNSNTNDVVVTLRSLKTHTYEQPSDRGTIETKISLDKYNLSTPQGFAQAAKDNGTMWSMGIPVQAIDKSLYNVLKSNGTWNSDINGEQVTYVNFYIGLVGKEVRAYTNYNGDAYIPAGTYEAYWSQYNVSANGAFTEFYINEIPLEFAAKAEVQGRTVAAIEGELTWASDEELSASKNIFPTTIKGKVYLANFLLDVSVARTNNKLSVDISLEGPSICKFEIHGELNYRNGNVADLELTENDVISANVKFTFNSDEITLNVDSMSDLVTAMQDLDARNEAKDPNDPVSVQDYIDTANTYIDAVYSFAGEELAKFVADAEQYVVVEYPDGSTEAGQDLVMRYASLVNTDYVMQVLEPLFGDGKEDPKETTPTPVEPSYDYSKFYSNIWNDGSYVYANYNYTYADGKTTSVVNPDKVDMVVYSKGEGCTSAYCNTTQYSANYDGSQYTFDYTLIASDPTVVAAYIYATYTSSDNGKFWDDTYYVVGSAESLKDHSSAPTDVFGCTDATANNYDSKATQDDGTCKYTPSVTIDIAGYSLMSAQDPAQFVIGFKLSTDPQNLATPDYVYLTLYYMDGSKTSTSLSQNADGYYVGSNSFVTDDNIKGALVGASTTIDGSTIYATSTLK